MDEMTMQFLLDNQGLLLRCLARVVSADEEMTKKFVGEYAKSTRGGMNPRMVMKFLECASRPDDMKLI